MAYILGLVVVSFFFLAMHYFTELTKVQKLTITVVILVIVLGAIAFNAYSTSQTENMMNAVRKFKQNKTISCDGVEVNSANYTLSIGTYTFIGKQNTPNYTQMISASNCK